MVKINVVDKVMFATGKDDWETPDDLFNHFNKLFHLNCDVCATHENTKVKERYFTKNNDGLKQTWSERNWCNPPYSKGKQWLFIKKAYEESLIGKLTVVLIPARPDTKTWHDYVMKSDYVQFIKGRLKFKGGNNSAPFPSCVVIFGLKYLKN